MRTIEIKIVLFWVVLVLSNATSAQQVCSDTITRNRFFLNSDTSLVVYKNFLQPTGNSYFVGRSWKSASSIFNAVLVKKDRWGNAFWNKIITTANNDSSIIISQLLELTDKSILALGIIQSSSPFTVSSKPVLLHLDDNGIVINSWRIDLKEPSNINGFFRSFLCQINSNSIGLLVNYTTEDETSAFIILKLDITNGNCIWSSKFYKNSFFYVNGLIASNDELIIASNFSNSTFTSQQKQGINFIKLNTLTGVFNSSKSYENVFATNLQSMDYYGTLSRLANGTLNVVYGTSKDNEPNKIVCVNLDNDFNILKATAIGNIIDNYLVRNYSINGAGSFAFSFFNATKVNDQGYIIIDSVGRLIQQRKLKLPTNGNFTAVFSNNDLTLTDDNKLTLFPAVNSNSKVEFETVSTNIYNKDTGCVSLNFNEAVEEYFSLQSSSWSLDQENNLLPELNSYAVNNSNLFIQQQQVCLSIKNYGPSLPDELTKCNDDSVVLKASPDFISYTWQPNTSQIQINDSTIKVFPASTNNYSVIAQTYWGCEMKDTTKLIAVVSPIIKLGNDTSVCEGSIVNLNAGSGFADYSWNDGSTSSFMQVTIAGKYFVNAVDSNGCTSRDTFNLVKVYSKPVINIHQKQILCKEQSDVLKPGTFASYLWQDGSSGSDFEVENAGKYWVTVVDGNGCVNSDTVVVNSVAGLPSNFIIQDTAVCQYETIQLQPKRNFTSYFWSTNSSTFSISVSKGGAYWLEVIDSNGCQGRGNINVSFESCPVQIFFPSAFTPNGDGKNDFYKPLVKGPIEHYEFLVFNRWGQKIFSTDNFLNGWNGSVGNKVQDNGVFIWMCQYQFKDQKFKIEKGSFLLMR